MEVNIMVYIFVTTEARALSANASKRDFIRLMFQ